MIKRRHKIVHETDANQIFGSGNHSATSINKPTTEAWKKDVLIFVRYIEDAITSENFLESTN